MGKNWVVTQMLKNYIKSFQDFPIKGIDFKDVASLCANAEGFAMANDILHNKLMEYMPCDKLIGIDARGFPFASVLSYKEQLPLVLARKQGKLPGNTHTEEFALEYGTASLEIQDGVIEPNDRVIIVDDLMATGGTVGAAINLVEQHAKAKVVAVACLIDLVPLQGSKTVTNKGIPFVSAVEYT